MPRKVSQERQAEFYKLVAEWHLASAHLSPSQTVNHPSYQKMIRMGDDAVVLMLREFQQDHIKRFFHALAVITQEQPIDCSHLGNERAMAADWVAMGIKDGIID